MLKRIRPAILTCIAGALMVSISACSTSPINPDSTLGHATESVAEATASLWAKTRHVFRLDGSTESLEHPDDEFLAVDGAAGEFPDAYKDEVDLALVQENRAEFQTQNADQIPGQNASLSQEQNAGQNMGQISEQSQQIVSELPGTNELQDSDVTDIGVALANPDNVTLVEVEEPAVLVTTAPAELEPSVLQKIARTVEIDHVVQQDETLWKLSKQLTGDATNWRILAELNGLDENGTVFPGQKLHIPADLANGKGVPDLAAAKPVVTKESANADDNSPIVIQEDDAAAVAKAEAVETVTKIVTADKTPAAPKVNVPTTAFEVQAGETMWDLAKRTTGNATNWKAIAAANSMTDKQAAFIKYGEKVGVPTDLLKSGASATDAAKGPAKVVAKERVAEEQVAKATEVKVPAVAAATRLKVPAADIPAATPAATRAIESSATVSKAEVSVEEKPSVDGEVKIMPAGFRADPPVIPELKSTSTEVAKVDVKQPAEVLPKVEAMVEAKIEAEAVIPKGSSGEWVMVSGTYYPKAIYNDANFSAPLLMRVSPGTKLQVARAVGPWFEVKTDRGVGFVHSRDIK